ncbi:MAG: nucleotidyltransferase domain-containing protein [Spirochaetia bacterium]|nr:nucleotidyltransferase domain-containing protein [Spirochaetia bacterium]
MLNSNIVEKIIQTFRDDPRFSAIFLLGSALTDHMRPDSDIDVAVLPFFGKKIDDISRMSLATDFTIASGLKLDIGIISSANLVYAKEAILTGREIYVKDRGYTDLMTATLMGMYLAFQDQRREVLNAYRIR